MSEGTQDESGEQCSLLSHVDLAWHILFAVRPEHSLPHRWREGRPGDEVRAAHDVSGVLKALAQQPALDCCVIDLCLPNGAGHTVLRDVRERNPDVLRVAIVERVDASTYNALVAEWMPVFRHPVRPGELASLLNASARLHRARLRRVVRQLAKRQGLTPRETEVLEQRALGKTRLEACELLGIKPSTYDNHVASILEKSGGFRTARLVLELQREAGAQSRAPGFDNGAVSTAGEVDA